MIDQFIVASLSKWQRMSGLVMLLPHGYEGQGPEHSNARPERFLQLAAEQNIIVANCTTPASFFHLIRRQLAWDFRRPLVVMSPKSLLRHPLVQSEIKELTAGKFQEIIPDNSADTGQVKKVLMCSGKVYYDLLDYRTKNNRSDVALLRFEQLYPFPINQLEAELKKYPDASVIWVQEEPMNMGAWFFILNILKDKNPGLVSRKASASPATGYSKVHAKEQIELMEMAFNGRVSNEPVNTGPEPRDDAQTG
jgi:2-oxoglutarate dehydrogenase E1 component